MPNQLWKDSRSKTIVCLDSYEAGVPKGRIYLPYQQVQSFESLTQFLVKMETLLDELQTPQSSTMIRSFLPNRENTESTVVPLHIRRGSRATFEVRVIYRQHSSWQGVIIWLEKNMVQSFRSVLELVKLMDNALQNGKETDTA